ncbi:hypothetical protein [Gudongella sp. DL1XJH-153]
MERLARLFTRGEKITLVCVITSIAAGDSYAKELDILIISFKLNR